MDILTRLPEKLLSFDSFADALAFLRAISESELPTGAIINRASQYPDLLGQLSDLTNQRELALDPSRDECRLL